MTEIYSLSSSAFTNVGLKEMRELNFTDNFKDKFFQNIFLVSINYQFYKSNPKLGDWNMLKMLNYHQNAL